MIVRILRIMKTVTIMIVMMMMIVMIVMIVTIMIIVMMVMIVMMVIIVTIVMIVMIVMMVMIVRILIIWKLLYSRDSLNSTKSNQKIWQKVRISDKKSGFFDSIPAFWQKVRILFPDFLSGLRTYCQKSGHIVRKKTTVQRDFFIWRLSSVITFFLDWIYKFYSIHFV